MKNIFAKWLAIQKEIKPIVKDETNSHFKNSYFDINTLIGDLKPILNKNGVVVMQPLDVREGKTGIRTSVIDVESGEFMESFLPLSEQLDPQKLGAMITYYRRYALTSLFLLEAEDDDGNLASTPKAAPRPVQSATDPSLGTCTKCGAGMAISKSTGKPYCQQRCWLTPEQKAQPMPKFDPKESAQEDYSDMGFEIPFN